MRKYLLKKSLVSVPRALAGLVQGVARLRSTQPRFAGLNLGSGLLALILIRWSWRGFAGLVHVCLRCEASKHQQAQQTVGKASEPTTAAGGSKRQPGGQWYETATGGRPIPNRRRWRWISPSGSGPAPVPPGPGFQLGDLFIWGMTAHLLDVTLRVAGWERSWDRDREAPVPGRFLRD